MRKQTQKTDRPEFVDLTEYRFVLEPRYYCYGWARTPRLRARQSAVAALVQAREYLPHGCNFKVWDAQRSYTVHVAMLESFRRRLWLLYPKASIAQLRKLQRRFGGRALKQITRLDTHRNGGSFDLTIVDRNGNELYMGTDHDDLTPRAALDFFETRNGSTPLGRIARANRRLLRRVMIRAGFTPYPAEWWHWSLKK